MQSGIYKQACEAFTESIKYDSDNAYVYNNLGLALARLGKSEQAISSWKQAIKINPDLAEAYTNLGKALHKKNHSEEKQEIGVKPDS